MRAGKIESLEAQDLHAADTVRKNRIDLPDVQGIKKGRKNL
jgi:hypothetical protein